MFNNGRYLTCGVDNTVPIELQLFLWECVDRMPAPKDYLQVFELSPSGSMQSITHSSEEPEYRQVYMIPSDTPNLLWYNRNHRRLVVSKTKRVTTSLFSKIPALYILLSYLILTGIKMKLTNF